MVYEWHFSCQLGDYILPTTLYRNLKNSIDMMFCWLLFTSEGVVFLQLFVGERCFIKAMGSILLELKKNTRPSYEREVREGHRKQKK